MYAGQTSAPSQGWEPASKGLLFLIEAALVAALDSYFAKELSIPSLGSSPLSPGGFTLYFGGAMLVVSGLVSYYYLWHPVRLMAVKVHAGKTLFGELSHAETSLNEEVESSKPNKDTKETIVVAMLLARNVRRTFESAESKGTLASVLLGFGIAGLFVASALIQALADYQYGSLSGLAWMLAFFFLIAYVIAPLRIAEPPPAYGIPEWRRQVTTLSLVASDQVALRRQLKEWARDRPRYGLYTG